MMECSRAAGQSSGWAAGGGSAMHSCSLWWRTGSGLRPGLWGRQAHSCAKCMCKWGWLAVMVACQAGRRPQ